VQNKKIQKQKTTKKTLFTRNASVAFVFVAVIAADVAVAVAATDVYTIP